MANIREVCSFAGADWRTIGERRRRRGQHEQREGYGGGRAVQKKTGAWEKAPKKSL